MRRGRSWACWGLLSSNGLPQPTFGIGYGIQKGWGLGFLHRNFGVGFFSPNFGFLWSLLLGALVFLKYLFTFLSVSDT